MNDTELLADLQTQHDKTTTQTGQPHHPTEHLSTTQAETQARLADPATTTKVIAEPAPAGTDPDPPETNTAYQAIVNTINQHPNQKLPARELHELLGTPTNRPSTSPTATPDTSPAKTSSPNPNETATRNRPNPH